MHFLRVRARRYILAALVLAVANLAAVALRADPDPPARVVVTDTSTEILDVVRFEPGTADIQPSSLAILNAVAETLQGNPSIAEVEIQAHMDGTGEAAAALDLSDARALAVTRYLVAKGVDETRLSPQGYGNTQPLGSPDKNERVAFLILKRIAE